MNISKSEQRTLHALAQGGRIIVERDERKRVTLVECITRDGWVLSDCTPSVFARLKRRRWVASREGRPYAVTREGLLVLRPQLDNRVGPG